MVKKTRSSILKKVNDNWKAWGIIGGIVVVAIGAWTYAMAQVEKTAEAKVQATINKAMIDGANQAAAQAVTTQLPAISKQVAVEVVNQLKQEQMIKPAPVKETEKKP